MTTRSEAATDEAEVEAYSEAEERANIHIIIA
jgi:hypothetical protein